MTPLTIGLIFMGVMLILLFLGVSVGSSMTMAAFAGFAILASTNAAITKVGSTAFDTLNNYNYAVIPLFVLMANIISTTGVGKALYDFFQKCVGRFRGGLAMATILACAIFSAISSTTVATAVTIGLIALPEMKRAGYSNSLSTGTIASGGTLGVLIPPSSVMITYAIIAQASMTKLFVAGVVPGIILALLMCIAVYVTCLINPNAGPKGEKSGIKAIAKAFLQCAEVIILIVLVLGGMFIGWFTPTEAGAIGAGSAILVTLIRKKLTFKNFLAAIKGTLENTGMVYLILIGAFILNYFVAAAGISNALANLISGLNLGYKAVTIIIMFIFLILGCFLDSLAMVLLTMPIFYPVATSLGADPLWFGVIVTIAMQLGCLTPPVGMNIFVVAGLDKRIRMEEVFKGVVPFIVAIFVTIALLVIWPELATWLPSLTTVS
jgi:C4-dicarboxylate transporter DctM subunit